MKISTLIFVSCLLLACGSDEKPKDPKIQIEEFYLEIDDSKNDVTREDINIQKVSLKSDGEILNVEVLLVGNSSTLCNYLLIIGTGEKGKFVSDLGIEYEEQLYAGFHKDFSAAISQMIYSSDPMAIDKRFHETDPLYDLISYNEQGASVEFADFNTQLLSYEVNPRKWAFPYGYSGEYIILDEDSDYKFYSSCGQYEQYREDFAY